MPTGTTQGPESEPATPAFTPALADYTGHLLRRAFARARDCAQQVLPRGRHPGEGAILANLAAGGAASQQELSERLRVNRTIMVRLVDRLEAAGLVRRDRNPRDRRSYALVLTAKGQQTLRAMEAAADRGEALLTVALRPQERRRLNQLLRRLLPDPDAGVAASLADRNGFLITHAHYRLRERGDQALAPLGVEPRHFAALAVLDGIGPAPQRRLAGQLGVSGPVVVQLVDQLERAGLVQRHRNPQDRREYALRLTHDGRTRLGQARRAIDAVQAEVTAQLGHADGRELNALLRKLLTAPPVTRTRRDTQDPDLLEP
jgi:DNA-binding MarR family transcriptional regulator